MIKNKLIINKAIDRYGFIKKYSIDEIREDIKEANKVLNSISYRPAEIIAPLIKVGENYLKTFDLFQDGEKLEDVYEDSSAILTIACYIETILELQGNPEYEPNINLFKQCNLGTITAYVCSEILLYLGEEKDVQ